MRGRKPVEKERAKGREREKTYRQTVQDLSVVLIKGLPFPSNSSSLLGNAAAAVVAVEGERWDDEVGEEWLRRGRGRPEEV